MGRSPKTGRDLDSETGHKGPGLIPIARSYWDRARTALGNAGGWLRK